LSTKRGIQREKAGGEFSTRESQESRLPGGDLCLGFGGGGGGGGGKKTFLRELRELETEAKAGNLRVPACREAEKATIAWG